ncbi:hypothetical protein K0M31_004504 [Melipona bicolor]|uniref:Netrin receptor UNC5A-D-like N-terminal domain-containing protein n=1 Tax=Melipona bicolor TaxID=60889 RepID=A0AA40FWX0_9HYME|nr:hypothetical protein K0M31_004504 [Melipona bicolor]
MELKISILLLALLRLACTLENTKEEEDDAEEDDEENYPVDDYDYGDYDTATITSDIDLIVGGSLPIFLAEPVDTFVVKGKPATLHCRAAHALQVRKTGSLATEHVINCSIYEFELVRASQKSN